MSLIAVTASTQVVIPHSSWPSHLYYCVRLYGAVLAKGLFAELHESEGHVDGAPYELAKDGEDLDLEVQNLGLEV